MPTRPGNVFAAGFAPMFCNTIPPTRQTRDSATTRTASGRKRGAARPARLTAPAAAMRIPTFSPNIAPARNPLTGSPIVSQTSRMVRSGNATYPRGMYWNIFTGDRKPGRSQR
jgi:hypothetical protein